MSDYSIALVAHDEKKAALVSFVTENIEQFLKFRLFSTGTTGSRILEALPQLSVERLKSGPMGGDQQIGAMIATGALDGLIFFVDPLTPLPHDVDVKALTRLAVLYDIPMALNRRTADLMIDHLASQSVEARNVD
jgi:methylglyoxal synthase